MRRELHDIPRAGWPIRDWCAAVGISRPTFYRLSNPPESVHLNDRHIITEAPPDYLKRVASHQKRPEAA